MRTTKIAPGISLVEVPEVDLRILCGCPENAVKHLMKAGAIAWTESGGRRYETGPNAILLSERPIIGGRFANAAEFPVLQMLYRQGMILPGFPANTGRRPMLIGLREQLEAQARYIHLGNYGLSSLDEMVAAGMPPELAQERMAIKLAFSFGSITPVKDFLELRPVDAQAVELRDGVFIRRLGDNRYAFIYAGQRAEVDLELRGGQLAPPYELPPSRPGDADFAVLHLGEGDGWDPSRPCIGSAILHRGDWYLVDAGPNIKESLDALGLSLSDLAGVFHTHVHDDHFIGLASLFRGPRRLLYCAVPWVRAAAAKKLSALAGIGEGDFCRYFEVHDLEEGAWQEIRGLEVLPIHSPHPVETTILRFRAFGKTYAHWADLSSFQVLDSMARPGPVSGPPPPGMDPGAVARVKADYLEAADLKKIDAGGGMIHGEADDFAHDSSGLILISHTDSPGAVQRPWARIADFGEVTILAPRLLSPVARAQAPQGTSSLASLIADAFRVVELPDEGPWRLSLAATRHRLKAGTELGQALGRGLSLVEAGRLDLLAAGDLLSQLGPGDFWGEEQILHAEAAFFSARLGVDTSLVFIPAEAIEEFPSLLWHLKEVHESRLAVARANFSFQWRAEYSVGVGTLDEAHKALFEGLSWISGLVSKDPGDELVEAELVRLKDVVLAHYADEEARMKEASFPGLAEHARIHGEILEEIDLSLARFHRGEVRLESLLDIAKDRLLEHSLLIDREYIPWLSGKATKGE